MPEQAARNAKTVDRWVGLFFIGVAALFYGAVIPWQIETVDYGWLKPRTLPRILAVIIAIAGLGLVLRPTGDARPTSIPWLKSGLFAVCLIGALILIAQFGFVYVSPLMALVIMVLSGERRPLWLGLGVVVLPFVIWFCVVVLLGRPLP